MLRPTEIFNQSLTNEVVVGELLTDKMEVRRPNIFQRIDHWYYDVVLTGRQDPISGLRVFRKGFYDPVVEVDKGIANVKIRLQPRKNGRFGLEVGRDSDNDVVIENSFVSRNAMRVSYSDNPDNKYMLLENRTGRDTRPRIELGFDSQSNSRRADCVITTDNSNGDAFLELTVV
jgi:hypothetical protein